MADAFDHRERVFDLKHDGFGRWRRSLCGAGRSSSASDDSALMPRFASGAVYSNLVADRRSKDCPAGLEREDFAVDAPAGHAGDGDHRLQRRGAELGAATNAFSAVGCDTRDADGRVMVAGVVSTKVGDHWTVKGVVAIDHAVHISGGFEVKATW